MAIIHGSGSDSYRKTISRKVKSGELIKLYTSIYTDETDQDLSEVVRLYAWEIASYLAPGGIVSHRSAYDPRVNPDGHFFITYKRNRKIEMQGVIFVLLKGPPPVEGDRQLGDLNLFQSQYERMLLENLQSSRGLKKGLGKEKVETILHDLLIAGGDNKLNTIRDRARKISKKLGMEKEYGILNEIIGALLTTYPLSKLESEAGRALAKGFPYDSYRIKMFESLAMDLDKEQLPHFGKIDDENIWKHFSFFEAYFSNYIEGTVFTVEEANEIISTGKALPTREQDSHDILGTYKLTVDKGEMGKTPGNPDSLKNLLRSRHQKLLKERQEKNPGMFKQRNNLAGSYVFVDHRMVAGTLEKAWKFYDYLQDPVARSYYISFVISEVHPFEDGNGRIARIMMNAELHASGLRKIMIPNVYRRDYLAALRAMSNNMNSIPLINMFSRIFEFSSTINQDNFDDMRQYLDDCNAFSDQENVILRF